MPHVVPALLESLFGLIVHDLRNPAATLGANIEFLREVLEDEGVPLDEKYAALADSHQALTEMMRGLDQVSWMGRWMNDRKALPTTVEDIHNVLAGVKQRIVYGAVTFDVPEGELKVPGGQALERLIELLVCNGHQHAQRKPVHVRVVRDEATAVIEVEDQGVPLAPEFAQSAFTLEGQLALKGRADGRYGRVAALFAAGVLAQSVGAQLVAEARSGRNVFRVTLPAG